MIYSKNVFDKIYESMVEVGSVVGKTLGPHGKNVVIQGFDTRMSSDGLTVARAITYKDNIMNIGKNILVNGAELTFDLAGDGTTSTMLLAISMVQKIKELSSEGNIVIDYKEIDEAQKDILNTLDELSFPAIDEDILYKVAFTSSNNHEISKCVSEAVMKIKEYGYIRVVPTFSNNITYDITEGVSYDKGYISPFLVNDIKVVLKDAYVIIVDDNITKINELEGIIYDVKKTKKDILLVALGYSKEVIDYLVYLKKNNNLNICATLAPEYGNISSLYLDDLAIYLDTVIITTKTLYHTIDTIGHADYIEITQKNTIINVNKPLSSNGRLMKRIETLKNESLSNKESLIRLSRLTNGVAKLYLPCQKDYEYLVLKEKANNSISSTINSYKGKGLYGAGVSLLEVYDRLKNKLYCNINGKRWNNTYEAIISSLLIIKKTLDRNSIGYENEVNYENVIDALDNVKAIINNSFYILRLILGIDAIIVCDDMDNQVNTELF